MPAWFSVGVAGKQQNLPRGSAVNFSISSTDMQEGKRHISTYVLFFIRSFNSSAHIVNISL
jgi:hypothetical protein